MENFLFGFTTVRNPSVIKEPERIRFHVLMDEQDRHATRLWSDLPVAGFREVKKEIVARVRSGAFVAPTLGEIRSEHRDRISLYREINAEHNRRSLADLPGFVEELGLEPLTGRERVTLWDAYAFYLWADPQRDEIDTITAVFVADKVLGFLRVSLADNNSIDEEEEAILRRVGRARIVLPLRVDNRLSAGAAPRLSVRQKRMLVSAHEQIVAQGRIAELEGARDEIADAFARAAERRRGNERREEGPREAALRSRLAGRVAPEELGSVLSDLLAVTRSSTDSSSFSSEVSEILINPAARRLFERVNRPNAGPSETLGAIEEEIEEAADTIDPELLTTHTATVLAFGTEFTVEERLPAGALALKMHREKDGGYHVYMTYHHAAEVPPLGAVAGTIKAGTRTLPIAADAVAEQEEAFQTFRLTAEPIEAASVEISLTLMSLAPEASPESLDPITLFPGRPFATVVDLSVPDETFEIEPTPILHGITRLGMIEYRRVEQELNCYMTGEISRIENILASEFKERVSRSLTLIETEQEITQETSSEYQTDTETSEKLEMQAEVSEVLSEETEKSFDAGVSVSAGYGNVAEMTADTGFHYNTVSSKEQSTSEAIEIAKTVTRKVQRRLMQKATSRRRSLSRREFEDINKHGFDNRQNPDHVVGVYRYVDKIYTHRLVNLGEREVIEIVIPEPAKAFIFAQQEVQEAEEGTNVHRPKRPVRVGLKGPWSLKVKTWRKFARIYKIELDPPPPSKIFISRAFGETLGGTSALGSDEENGESEVEPGLSRGTAFNEIEIPDGYTATHASVRMDSKQDPRSTEAGNVNLIVGDHRITGGHFIDDTDQVEFDLPDIAEMLPVSVSANAVTAYVANITVKCKRRRRTFRQWQMRSYNLLMEAYRSQKAAYDEAREENEEAQEQIDLNPRFKRQHMAREIKRICIEMLTEPFGVETSADHYLQTDEKTYPKIQQLPHLNRHAMVVKFFEQAFDWSIMSYIFYPYFYGPKSDWSVKLSLEATRNQIFSSFLSSGMARVMLPVREGMEDAVNYYLDTGEVWFGGGFVIDAKNDLYLSIADELMSSKGREETIEATWETKLPTNHTILQSASSALIEDGLPCRDPGERIGQGRSTLAPVLPTNTPEPG